jgi:hypothetical protein
MTVYLKVLWAALLGRPIIARCCFLERVVLGKSNRNVLVIGNFSQGIGPPPEWQTPKLPIAPVRLSWMGSTSTWPEVEP